MKLSDIEFSFETLSEHDHYIQQTVFYHSHLLTLCQQMENAIELLTNFDYSKKKVSRIEHLIYNVENFIIRVKPLLDRVSQLINAVFHLGLQAKDVKSGLILRNIHLNNSKVGSLYKDLEKTLSVYSANRNSITHKHSYLDEELKMLEAYYEDIFWANAVKDSGIPKDDMEGLRKKELTDCVIKIKKKFNSTLHDFFDKLTPLLDELFNHYTKTRNRLV